MQLCVDNEGDYFEHLMKSTLVQFLSFFIFILHHYHIVHTEISERLITWQDEEKKKKDKRKTRKERKKSMQE